MSQPRLSPWKPLKSGPLRDKIAAKRIRIRPAKTGRTGSRLSEDGERIAAELHGMAVWESRDVKTGDLADWNCVVRAVAKSLGMTVSLSVIAPGTIRVWRTD